jgi:hypothetical protein
VAAWALWALALAGLATVPWFEHLARQAGRPELTQLNASTIPYLLATVVAATVGSVLASRLPRHPVGWLLLALGLSVTGSGVADGYTRYGLIARPGVLPAARWVAIQPGDHHHGAGTGRLRPAADPDRGAAVAPLALVGLGRGGRPGGLRRGPDGRARPGDPAV